MFTKANSCPICFSPWEKDNNRCASCGSVAELYFERSFPARGDVDEEKLEQNVRRVRAYLVDHENHGLARYTLGLTYVNLGLLPEGLVEIRRATQLLPEKVQIAYEAVVLAARQDDFSDETLKQINRVIERKPDFKEALYLKGVILQKRKKVKDAVRAWQAAYKLDNNYEPSYRALRWFINSNEELLRKPSIVRSIRKQSAPQNAIDYLNLISSDEPVKPPPLGTTSMKLLEAISPEKAKLMRKMYAADLHRYEELLEQRSEERDVLGKDVIALSELSIAAVEASKRQTTPAITSALLPSSEEGRQLTLAERSQILEAEVQHYQRQGYALIARTETTAQLSKKHDFDCCLALILVVLVIGIILYLVYYLTEKKEHLIFLEVDEFGQIHKSYS